MEGGEGQVQAGRGQWGKGGTPAILSTVNLISKVNKIHNAPKNPLGLNVFKSVVWIL